ncbi:MAG: fibronectin type III domain-containing protein [Elusimicrobia bacterium]|nr:fibronectin type III domain-containing protein [Elusimicrobiota bacterium]
MLTFSLLLGTLLTLFAGLPARAVGPNMAGPQVQQCDGTFKTGTTTRKASPRIRVPIQTDEGLRVGAQPASYRANAGLGLWRFNGTYTKVQDANCVNDGLTRIMSWHYEQTDAEGGVKATMGRCTYAATALLQYADSCGPSGTGPCTSRCSDDYNQTCTWDWECGSWNCVALRCSNGVACNTDDVYYSDCAGDHVAPSPMPLNAGLPGYTPQITPLPLASCGTSSRTMETAAANPSFPAGYYNEGLNLDGAHYLVLETTTALMLGPHYSLSAWIRTSSLGQQVILSHDDGGKYWGFGVNNGALERFDSREAAGNQTRSVGSGFADGNWHHVAAVRWDNDSWKIFKDGRLEGTTAAAAALYFPTGFDASAFIGSRNGGTRFTGDIDDLRIWRYAMTDDEVASEYNSTLHRFSSDGGTSYSYVFRSPATTAYVPAASDDTTLTVYYEPPVQPNITTQHRYGFIAQDNNGEVTSFPIYYVSVDQTPPAKPVLTGTAQAVNAIEWTWSTPASICGPPEYAAYYTLINPSNNTAITSVFDPTLSITESYGGEPPNQLHGRVLSATDSFGTSPLSDGATAYTTAGQPTGLAATAISTASTVFVWSNQTNPSYTRQELQYTATAGFGGTLVTLAAISDDFTGSSRAVSGLQSGTTYYARVRSKNGRQTDNYGTVFTDYTTLDFTTMPPPPVLTGTPLSTGSVRWDWTSVSGAFGYKLYSSTDGLMLDTPVLTFSSATLSTNTAYGASVEAYGRYGTSGPRSALMWAFTLATSPVSVALTAVSTNEVTVAWSSNGNSPQTYYEVVTATNAAFERALSTTGVIGTSAVIGDLFPLTTYYFRVRTVSGGGVPTPFVPQTPLKATTYPNPNVGVSSGPASPYALQPDLAGAWHFDEGSGTAAADASLTANNGLLTCLTAACSSTPTFTTGPSSLGSAVSFPGLPDSLVRIPANAAYDFAGDVTVSAWVKPATVSQSNGAGILTKGIGGSEDFSLDVYSGRYRFMFLGSRTVSSTMSVTAGAWAHVTGVYSSVSGGTLNIYVNGVLSASTSGLGGRPWTATPATIGNRQSGAGSFDLSFAGVVDEARIYRYAMSDAQVLADYRASLPGLYTPPPPVTGVQLELPPNAFTTGQAFIFVSPDPVYQPVRPGVNLIESGLTVMPTGQRFIKDSLVEIVPIIDGVPYAGLLGSAATVYLSYDDADGDGVLDGTAPPIHASTLRAYVFEPSVMRWAPLPTTPDLDRSRVAALTPHFSVFGLFGAQVYGNSLSEVRVFPIPWQIRSGGRFDAGNLVFDRLPTDGIIRIYSLAGEKIVELSFGPSGQGRALWNGNNFAGTPAASGVYLAHVKSATDGAERIMKFVVER